MVMSILNFFLNICSLWSQHQQAKLYKAEMELLYDEIKKRQKEAEPRACVEAEIIKVENCGSNCIRVRNSGNVEVYGVSLLIEDSDDLYMEIVKNESVFVDRFLPGEGIEIFFTERLLPGKAYEISFKIAGESVKAFKVAIKWEGDSGVKGTREDILIA